MTRPMTRAAGLEIVRHFHAAPPRARADVAAWLQSFGDDYLAGLADALRAAPSPRAGSEVARCSA